MGKWLDYTGEEWTKFGHTYTVVGVAPSLRLQNGQIQKRWQVKHSKCGRVFLCSTASVKSRGRLVCSHCDAPIAFGDVFTYWEVIGEKPVIKKVGAKTGSVWLCRCRCGIERYVTANSLRTGSSQSCGCLNREILSGLALDLTNQSFGRLRAIKRVGGCQANGVPWECYCDPDLGGCGQYCIVPSGSLTTGNTQSCGCLRQDTYDSNKIPDDLFGCVSGTLIGLCLDKERIATCSKTYWICYCSPELGGCGEFISLRADGLAGGHWQSCGCRTRGILRAKLSGSQSPHWAGGISTVAHLIRGLPEMKEWRQAVMARDDYTCQFSGRRGGSLDAHHIRPLFQLVAENNITTIVQAMECAALWEVSNGITLARAWHLQGPQHEPNSFHNVFGAKGCSQEDFRDWYMQL